MSRTVLISCLAAGQPCPSLLTTAACSGLRPEPDCRPRRTYLHLSYSYVSPFGPAILVTHDPKRSFARLRLRRQLRQIPFCAVRSQIAQLFVLHNLNLWSGSQWLPAASREVVVLRVLSADIFMSFRVLGYPPRCLRTEIFGGDMVATRTTSTKAALNGVRPKNILYSNA